MVLLGVPPDLSDSLFSYGKVFVAIVWCRYKAAVWAVEHPTPGDQYRQHLKSGGYRP